MTVYLTPTDKHWACDIEADNLLDKATTIWCCTVLNVVTKEEREFTDAEAFNVWRLENPDATFVGHNFLAYDAIMLNRFWGARISATRIVDTFILSQIYNPTYAKPKGCEKGAHSLEAWGIRLNYRKGDFDDFSKLTPEMVKYCRRDTRLTALLFRRLSERMVAVGFSERGCELEHLAWNIIQNKQRRNGFPFNYQKAQELYVTLREREEELKNAIYKLWPPVLQPVGSFKKPFKKDGEPSANYLRHLEQYPRVELVGDAEYVAWDFVEFNLGSPSQRVAKLLELGWEPTKLTKAGNPQVDEDALLEYAEASDTPEIKALAKWIVVNSRANMVNTWLNSYDETTGAIHGKLFIASTLRYKHSSPNSANIPAVRLKKDAEGKEHIQYGEDGAWTYECRDLWTCGDPVLYSLVGIDGTGIQNRCLIHGLIKTVGEEKVRPFKELALEGDVHKRNIEVLGLANKAAAKKFYYTLMMGGGGARLAADQAQFGTKMTSKEGEKLKKLMVASIPGFGDLIEALEDELERTGRITLCDDTPILVPSPHMVIPYLLQGDESRLMKRSMIYVDEEVRRRKASDKVFKVADIHDEWQYRVKKDHVDEFVDYALPCFLRAGESFNYNIPIEGDFKIGNTWAETH
jgi:hypothetical protein